MQISFNLLLCYHFLICHLHSAQIQLSSKVRKGVKKYDSNSFVRTIAVRPRQAIAYPCSDREKHQEGCSNRRKGNCWAEITENCEGDKSMKSRTGRKRKRPSISGGLSDCCSLALWEEATGDGRLKTLEWRIIKKNQWCLSVFLIFRSFHMAPAWCALFKYCIPLQHPPTPVVCLLSSPLAFFPPSLYPFSSLMTELLAGDMKAAFSHRKSILNSQERDQLSEMLNWTLDLSLACLIFLKHSSFLFSHFHLSISNFSASRLSLSIYCC